MTSQSFSMTVHDLFDDVPGLENVPTKFHEFPLPGDTLCVGIHSGHD